LQYTRTGKIAVTRSKEETITDFLDEQQNIEAGSSD
jgi:acetolactate synthase-1/3 small subunit